MKTQGFIMFYAVIIIGVMLGAAGAIMRSTRTESSVALQGADATTAVLAADAGLECVRYWQLGSTAVPHAFSANETAVNATIDCGVNGAAPVTINHPFHGESNCLGADPLEPDVVYPTFTIGPFTNQSCAQVTVTVSQVMVDGQGFCKFAVQSRGLDDCTNPTVERILWENI
jgi:hypothetical protein